MLKLHDNFSRDTSFVKDTFLRLFLTEMVRFDEDNFTFVNDENKSLFLHSVGYFRQV